MNLVFDCCHGNRGDDCGGDHSGNHVVQLQLYKVTSDLGSLEMLWQRSLKANRWAGVKPRFSPDGRWLACDQPSGPVGGDIWAIPVSGADGEAIRLTHFPFPARLLGWFDWAPDGRLFVSIQRDASNHCTAITFDDAGNSYITGYSMDGNAARDYVTISCGPSGGQRWKVRYGQSTDHEFKPWDIEVSSNGTVAVTGQAVYSSDDTDVDIATVLYNASNGTEVWPRSWSGIGEFGTFYDYGRAVAFGSDGSVHVCGEAQMTCNGVDFVTIKYSTERYPAVSENPQRGFECRQ